MSCLLLLSTIDEDVDGARVAPAHVRTALAAWLSDLQQTVGREVLFHFFAVFFF